ncbi:BMC domain-containing protein [Calidifontibacillus oryziterrae]|uniref:BMC domain-containing protein n=1 Tax=Calidifontibacillus oryziterrae TaxID=1191699 RepID=UPI0002E450AF|nr:BMC domain-containing protein [Calidifontibacillus oryziterrae]
MKKYEAIGVIEAQYFATAMELLDEICKASNVEFVTSENYLGGRLVTLIVGGSIPDATTAIRLAKQICENKPKNPLKMALVITNPHSEILKFIVPSKIEGPGRLSIVEDLLPEDHSKSADLVKTAKKDTSPKQKRRKRTSKTEANKTTTKTSKEALS